MLNLKILPDEARARRIRDELGKSGISISRSNAPNPKTEASQFVAAKIGLGSIPFLKDNGTSACYEMSVSQVNLPERWHLNTQENESMETPTDKRCNRCDKCLSTFSSSDFCRSCQQEYSDSTITTIQKPFTVILTALHLIGVEQTGMCCKSWNVIFCLPLVQLDSLVSGFDVVTMGFEGAKISLTAPKEIQMNAFIDCVLNQHAILQISGSAISFPQSKAPIAISDVESQLYIVHDIALSLVDCNVSPSHESEMANVIHSVSRAACGYDLQQHKDLPMLGADGKTSMESFSVVAPKCISILSQFVGTFSPEKAFYQGRINLQSKYVAKLFYEKLKVLSFQKHDIFKQLLDHITKRCVEEFYRNFEQLDEIESLEMSGSSIPTSLSLRNFCTALPCITLVSLNLSDCQLNSNHLQDLCALAFPKMYVLEALFLDGTPSLDLSTLRTYLATTLSSKFFSLLSVRRCDVGSDLREFFENVPNHLPLEAVLFEGNPGFKLDPSSAKYISKISLTDFEQNLDSLTAVLESPDQKDVSMVVQGDFSLPLIANPKFEKWNDPIFAGTAQLIFDRISQAQLKRTKNISLDLSHFPTDKIILDCFCDALMLPKPESDSTTLRYARQEYKTWDYSKDIKSKSLTSLDLSFAIDFRSYEPDGNGREGPKQLPCLFDSYKNNLKELILQGDPKSDKHTMGERDKDGKVVGVAKRHHAWNGCMECLMNNLTLTKLDIRGQLLGDAAMEKLGLMALKKNRCLTALYIDGNRIGPLGLKAFSQALKSNKKIYDLPMPCEDIRLLYEEKEKELLHWENMRLKGERGITHEKERDLSEFTRRQRSVEKKKIKSEVLCSKEWIKQYKECKKGVERELKTIKPSLEAIEEYVQRNLELFVTKNAPKQVKLDQKEEKKNAKRQAVIQKHKSKVKPGKNAQQNTINVSNQCKQSKKTTTETAKKLNAGERRRDKIIEALVVKRDETITKAIEAPNSKIETLSVDAAIKQYEPIYAARHVAYTKKLDMVKTKSLPPGWFEQLDPHSNRIFFIFPEQNISTWEDPRMISHPQRIPQYAIQSQQSMDPKQQYVYSMYQALYYDTYFVPPAPLGCQPDAYRQWNPCPFKPPEPLGMPQTTTQLPGVPQQQMAPQGYGYPPQQQQQAYSPQRQPQQQSYPPTTSGQPSPQHPLAHSDQPVAQSQPSSHPQQQSLPPHEPAQPEPAPKPMRVSYVGGGGSVVRPTCFFKWSGWGRRRGMSWRQRQKAGWRSTYEYGRCHWPHHHEYASVMGGGGNSDNENSDKEIDSDKENENGSDKEEGNEEENFDMGAELEGGPGADDIIEKDDTSFDEAVPNDEILGAIDNLENQDELAMEDAAALLNEYDMDANDVQLDVDMYAGGEPNWHLSDFDSSDNDGENDAVFEETPSSNNDSETDDVLLVKETASDTSKMSSVGFRSLGSVRSSEKSFFQEDPGKELLKFESDKQQQTSRVLCCNIPTTPFSHHPYGDPKTQFLSSKYYEGAPRGVATPSSGSGNCGWSSSLSNWNDLLALASTRDSISADRAIVTYYANKNVFPVYRRTMKICLDVTAKNSVQVAEKTSFAQSLTIVTQTSLDRLPRLQEMCMNLRDGLSLSAAIFVPREKSSDPVQILEIENKLKSFGKEIVEKNSFGFNRIRWILVFAQAEDEYYPVNALRNVALDDSLTDAVFLLDVDFVGLSEDFYTLLHQDAEHLALSLEVKTTTSNSSEEMKKKIEKENVAFVIPAFECRRSLSTLPMSYSALSAALQDNSCEAFHVGHYPQGHGATNTSKWVSNQKQKEDSSSSSSLPRHYFKVRYQTGYEPYILANKKSIPRYDERFVGYGLNKVSHLYHCAAKGVEFCVVPMGFVSCFDHEKSVDWEKTFGHLVKVEKEKKEGKEEVELETEHEAGEMEQLNSWPGDCMQRLKIQALFERFRKEVSTS